MRKFEKISFEQFKKDIKDDKELYDSIIEKTETETFKKLTKKGDKKMKKDTFATRK